MRRAGFGAGKLLALESVRRPGLCSIAVNASFISNVMILVVNCTRHCKRHNEKLPMRTKHGE